MAPAIHAQLAGPRIGYVYPAGAPQGAKLEVTVGGQHLEGFSYAQVSGTGVQAEWVTCVKPKENVVASIADVVTLQVTVAQDATPGRRELRLAAPSGLTNPLVFFIGSLPEFREKPPTKTGAQPETSVKLPAMLNGRIMPGEVDRYRFPAQKGQHLTFAALARELIPYLPDAVPGWFQAVMALYDAEGNEVAYADDFLFHPDPVIYYEVPKDGEYVLEIRDSIYRGRRDFVYRIAAGELPFITSIFPLGAKAGTKGNVEVKGWNLRIKHLVPDTAQPGLQWLGVHRADSRLTNRRAEILMESLLAPDAAVDAESASGTELVSNRVPFAVDTLPECLDQEPNNSPDAAQRLTLPIIVNGRMDSPRDWDVFAFQGRAGEQIAAQVFARRLGSPLDSVLKLTDAAGKKLAFNDDFEDPGAALITHHADSLLRVTLPADGTYCLHLGDVQQKGGPDYAYRLQVGAPRPGFQLRVVPSGINVAGGATVPLSVYALRQDGFSAEIALGLKGSPAGLRLSGASVPAGQDSVRLTLTVPAITFREPLSLVMEGRATVDGKEIVCPAVPADDMLQAFAYHHLVPANELKVVVAGLRAYSTTAAVLSPLPVKIPAGGAAPLKLAVRSGSFIGEIHVELDEPPEGLFVEKETPGREGTEVLIRADAAKIKPGLKGNLIFNGFALRPPEPGKPATAATRRGAPLGMLPAIPFEVVEAAKEGQAAVTR
jgi:hypothetical protein